jgi:acetyl-CoA C-acetyltransferase
MIYSTPVHIVDARRSPIGRLGGGLRSLSAADLALPVARAIVPESLKPAIRQVILGQVLTAGSGMNVARQLGLRVGLPQSVPAFVTSMVCGSGMKAIMLAHDLIKAGSANVVVAGGMESMTNAPHLLNASRTGIRYGSGAYGYVGYYGYWWSATQFSPADAYYRYMDCSTSGVSRSSYEETYGFSVRCVRD